ncbi:hypothetical protein HFO63_28090 [Rhizobium laguerreae]|uniref:hypothetical protein n=1 Tax=Rhizobium laguerreae TaxID=1076926 RepID=UPI001C91C1DA|nr:hypothetical protein [Rhizobium laguerreae]MBY3088410.1 hypothetical protein [Rhizobium laguerreae]MBY3149390.1 hypothetical protein [Rhizobium laguerreae]
MRKNAHRANTQQRRQWRAGVVAVAALLSIAGAPLSAAACGYENPSDLALGMLNWVFPKALYVRTAVWQAEQAGILPPRPEQPAKDIFGNAFRRAAMSMTGLGERMSAAAPADAKGPSFSVVLIPAVMWTTYTPAAGGYSVEAHADGPAKDDIVIVTDEKVVRALVGGLLDPAAAETYGLLRLYGPADGQDQVRASLAGLQTAKSESPAAKRANNSPALDNPG